jgi:hypothetical protein
MPSLIYDYETLGQNPVKAAVVCLATLVFEESRFLNNPYTYEELLSQTKLFKFQVEPQLKYGRTICPESVKWWKTLPPTIQALLKPLHSDLDISEIPSIFKSVNIGLMDKVYTRGNDFDPVINQTIYDYFKQNGDYAWWKLRDTRSLFDGMTYGHNIKNTFIPEGLEEKFQKHHPTHDIVMDVMRFQYLVQLINGD